MRMSLRRVCALLLTLVMALGCLTALAEETGSNTLLDTALARPQKTGTSHITIGNTTKVSGQFFTSYFGNNTSDIDVRTMIYGYSPVVWDNQLQFVPDKTVVKSISYIDKTVGRTYIVSLRDGLTYCDGTPITAADYVFGILLSCSPQLTEIGATTGRRTTIAGYENYASGKKSTLTGLHILNKLSYSITIKKEFEPYFYELSYLMDYPYPISVLAPGCEVKDDGSGAYITGDFTADVLRSTILDPVSGYMSHPAVTSGPYKLTSYDAESGKVDFEINPNYAGNFEGVKPWIDTVTLVPVVPADMMDQLKNGELDAINKVVDKPALETGTAMSKEDAFSAVNYPRLGYGFCAFACEQGPQQFQAVRQALAYAIDTEEYVKTVFGDYALPVYGYYGIGQWMFGATQGTIRLEGQKGDLPAASLETLNTYAYDLDKAIALLEEDGWTLNEKGEAFTAGTDTLRYKDVDGTLMPLSFDFALSKGNDTGKEVVDRFNASLPQIGAELVVHEVTFGELLSDYYRADGERKYDMNFMATNFVSVFDPYITFAGGENYQGSQNTSGIVDEELVSLAKKLITTKPLDVSTYLSRWVKMQERFNEVLPTLPLYSNVYMDFFTVKLQNYKPNAEFSWPMAIQYAYVEE